MSDPDRWGDIEMLYRHSYPRFVRVARAIVGDREIAAEAVQEGFADALRHCDQWSGHEPLGGWVWRCVLNRARKARPREHVAAEGERRFQETEPDPDLRARLAALPERQRLVVFLRYFADLSYGEIATALGVEVGTISATLHAAHSSLRTQLEEAHT
jgi:RNA polymerase sigma-70 factor (ECF subfamily)